MSSGKCFRAKATFTALSFILLLFPYTSLAAPTSSVIAQDSRDSQAQRLFQEGLQLFQQGQATGATIEQVLEKLSAARDLWREIGATVKEAQALQAIGLINFRTSNYPQAQESYERSLALYRDAGQSLGEALILSSLGDVYSNLGAQQKAIESYTQAASLLQDLGETAFAAVTLKNIGSVYASLGQTEQAIEFHHQAIAEYEGIDNREGIADTYDSLGYLYANLGVNQKALESFNQALSIWQAQGNSSQVANSLVGTGLVYFALGEREQALQAYEQALSVVNKGLDISQNQKARIGEGGALAQRSWVYIKQENYSQALADLQQALPIFQAIQHSLAQANVLERIGKVYDLQGNSQKSLQTYHQELTLRQELGDYTGEANSRYNIARLERKLGNLSKAKEQIELALEIVESQRNQVSSQDLRTSFFAEKQDYYEFYIDLLIELHQQNPTQGYDALALQTSERARARSLLEMLVEANANIRQGVDPKLLNQEQEKQQQLEAIEERRIQLLSGKHTLEQKNNLDDTREKILSDYQEIQRQIRNKSPRYAALTQPQPLSLQEIQQQVIDENTLLLEYFLGKERSYLWAITKAGISTYELPPREEIEAAVGKFRSILTNRRASPQRLQEASQNLSQLILSPVAEKLSNQRIVIVSDGALQYIPFSALTLSQSSDYTPLISQHEIITLPSASTLAVIRQESRNKTPANNTIAIIADPVFSSDDERVGGSNKSASQLPLEAQQINRAAKDVGINWTRLPGTRTEAEAILALIPESDKTTTSFDFAANRSQATSPELSNYRYIHFATHGFVNSDKPELSGIVLSLVNQHGEAQNGFLRLHDIFNLTLPAELVVLSACQTGLGEEIRGEGIMGLTRGLMYAGAERVVTSLWNVDDQATAKLMSQLYQGLLQEGLTPVAAFV